MTRVTVVRTCPLCHRPMWQKHAEVCPGPLQRIADPPARDEPECDCGPGFHQYPCPVAHWPTGYEDGTRRDTAA